MDVKILEERANPLLHRKEYTFEVDHAGTATPPRGDVRKELAKLVKVPADRLIIERMNARFGTAKTRGEAMAYATKEAVDVTVREHILIRNGLREKAVPVMPGAGGEAPAAPAAPTPKEEPKSAPPKAETPKEEPPKEHPKPEHPKAEHPKAEAHKPEGHKPEAHKAEAPKEAHKGEGHKAEKADKPEKPEKAEKGEKAEKHEKHEGKPKPAHEPKKES